MTITIRLKIRDAAFEEDRAGELAQVLTTVARRLTVPADRSSDYDGPLFDSNGNTVGSLRVTGYSKL